MPDNVFSHDSLRAILEAYPRCRLAHLPTPLQRLERLSARYDVNLLIKRDDETGLAFGGNKARKLDFLMADVLEQGARSVISWAGVQSNWCRQLAAACCHLGIRPVLLLFKRNGLPSELDGNLLLDLICDADVHVVDLDCSRKMMEISGVSDLVLELADREMRAGRKPYIAPIGASLTEGNMLRPLGAIAYVNAFQELLEQAEAEKIHIDAVVFATGSGSTHAGLVAGAQLLSPGTRIVGISVSESRKDMARITRPIVEQTFFEFGRGEKSARPFDPNNLIIFDEYLGEGYGIPNVATIEAIRLVGKTEGILLDPVYTGRAFVGLLDLIERGYFHPGENIVFLHTGGTPTIFPYREAFRKHLSLKESSTRLGPAA
ncbi:MAG: D-cysteine desulfhydrase family protein [Candidatus Acidiferrales bacterium]